MKAGMRKSKEYAHPTEYSPISKGFKVDHISRLGNFLVWGQEGLDTLAIRRSGERHIQLSTRENWYPKVNADASDGLTLGFVDGD